LKPASKLYFTEKGEGQPALVFLHYFGGSSHTWAKMIDELSPQFRCVAVDLPGFGASQSGLDNLSVYSCAEQVYQVITDLALQQYVLIGHSMGGKIAAALASMQPAGLQSVVLLAPSPPTPEPIKDNKRKSLKKAHGNYVALEDVVNSNTANPLPEQEVADAVNDNLRASQIVWNWWLESGSRENISAQMSKVKAPIIVISGEKDPNFTTRYLKKELGDSFPSISFTEIPNTGHLLALETPKEVADAIKNFLQNHIQ
jgi:pimeloyl-ACP methyl ester carboxylesterase